jgi:hypothetical protein
MGNSRKKFEELKEEANERMERFIKPMKHYDNTNGSLYKVALERGWNAYQFDAVKRIDRAYKKGCFKEDIEKTIVVLELMLNNK